jgi:hypothetical protein
LKSFSLSTLNKSPAEAGAISRSTLLGVHHSEDGAQGRAAFKEKRPLQFEGR